MKKRVRLQTAPHTNTATDLWLQHLISRVVVEQLQLPPRLKAKLLFETLPNKNGVNEMEQRKLHVFFRRVSTVGQDLEMQITADAPFREKLLQEEIHVIDEFAVSANKKARRKDLRC